MWLRLGDLRRLPSRPRWMWVWLGRVLRGRLWGSRWAGVMSRWRLCGGHTMWCGWRVRVPWTRWWSGLRSELVSWVVKRGCGFRGSWRPRRVPKGTGLLFAQGRGRLLRRMSRIALRGLLIRRMLTSRWVAWRSLLRWSLIRNGFCWSGLSRRLVWDRGWLIRRVLGSRWVLGGMSFRVLVRRMCWVRSFRERMSLRLRGLRALPVGCRWWGRRVDRPRVEVVGASGGVLMVRVLTMRSLRGRLVLVCTGRV